MDWRDLSIFLLAVCCSMSQAALIADYTFENASTESLTGNYDLNTVGTGVAYGLDGSVAFARIHWWTKMLHFSGLGYKNV